MKRILIGVPSYNAHVHSDVNNRLQQATKLHKASIYPESGSILPEVFNKLWCGALNGYERGAYDFFCMLHADVVPQQWWLDKLVELIQQHNADVVSVVVPLKSNQGLTSTALGGNDPWEIKKRLTLKECYRLPSTFSAQDCDHDGPLLVNTGCFIVDLSKEWTKAFYFTLESDIIKSKGQYRVRATRSEDWNMSRHIHRTGGKVLATREISVHHFGAMYYPNSEPYGLETDPDAI